MAGSRIATTHSSSASAVVKCPWKKSGAAITRSPRALRATTSPSRAARTQGISADASAWATLPPIVPRTRMAACPMKGSASASRGTRARTTASRSAARSRTVAPRTIASVRSSIVARPATPLMSTNCSGRAMRIANSGTRLCPPASTLASSPCSESSASTSSRVPGA